MSIDLTPDAMLSAFENMQSLVGLDGNRIPLGCLLDNAGNIITPDRVTGAKIIAGEITYILKPQTESSVAENKITIIDNNGKVTDSADGAHFRARGEVDGASRIYYSDNNPCYFGSPPVDVSVFWRVRPKINAAIARAHSDKARGARRCH